MAQLVTIRFLHIDWTSSVRRRILDMLDYPGHEVLLISDIYVDGGNDDGSHLQYRALLYEDVMSEDVSSLRTELESPPFSETLDVQGGRQITVEFVVEIHIGESVEVVGRVQRSLPPPFHLMETETPAQRTAPGTSGSSARTHPFRLTWYAANPLVLRPRRTTGPYYAARNLTTTVRSSNPPNCWQYNPILDNSLVVDSTEYIFGRDLINWKGWDTAENNSAGGCLFRSVFHQPKLYSGHTVRRDLSDIQTIILHEVAGWATDNPRFMNTRWCNNRTAAQFNVNSRGRIIQYYDVVQKVGHCSTPRNADAVGIEFVNIVWTTQPTSQQLTPPGAVQDRTPRRIIPGWVGMASRKYVVPPLAQLEALFYLVQLLLRICPDVPADYRALDAHGEPHQAGDTRKLFLMGRWQSVYNVANLPGLFSHFNVKSHTDGSFQALYLWLRTYANVNSYDGSNPAQKAYNAAIELTENNMVHHRCADGSRNYFVDVTSVHP